MPRTPVAKPDFSAAAAHEAELNDRQRQILDLLVAGRTNGEIAETLGISFDGAKWNVSEILTKLGLDSREDAAAYWRWRRAPHRRANRWLRGLFGTTAAKVAATTVGIAAAGLGGLVFWLVLAGGTGSAPVLPPVPGSFHIEGTYFERREMVAWQLQPLAEADHGTFASWYYDDTHLRNERTNLAPRLDAIGTLVLLDGTNLHAWDSDGYQLVPFRLLPPGQLKGPWPGPVGVGEGSAKTPEELVRWLSSSSSSSSGSSGFPVPHAAVSGEDTLLGRKTAVIEFGPTWVNGESQTSGGTGRIWMDIDSGIVLKVTKEGNDGSEMAHAEVTTFEWEPPIKASIFTAQPPPGVKTVDPYHPQPVATAPPPGTFLPLPPAPDGYTATGSGSGGVFVQSTMTNGVDSLVVEQRMLDRGLPGGLRSGVHHALSAGTAGYVQTIGTLRGIAFARGNVGVLITATGLPDTELIALAEAMLR